MLLALALLAVLYSATLQSPTTPTQADLPRLLADPSPEPGGGFRLSWTSVPGSAYTLQRWNGDDLAVVLSPAWVDVASVTAAGPLTSAVDPSSKGVPRRFYRVVRTSGSVQPNPGAPQLGPLQATPAGSTLTAPTLRLDVEVASTNLISSVVLFDGASPLGVATAVSSNRYRLVWSPTVANNGTHSVQAVGTDALGLTGTSPVLQVVVALPQGAPSKTLGLVTIQAGSFQTNSALVTGNGAIQLGTLELQNPGALQIDPVAGTISGSGSLSTPELGFLFTGSFTLDPQTGWLSSRSSALASASDRPVALSPISLNSRCILTPRTLSINVLTRDIRGTGSVDLTPEVPARPIRLDGSFEYLAAAHTLTLTGGFAQGSLSGTGRATLRLSDSVLRFDGKFQAPVLTQATLLYQAGAHPASGFISGLDVTGLAVSGPLAPDGQPSLAGAIDPTPMIVRQDPDRFVPLGADGLPIEQGQLRGLADGSLPPFEFRPAGRSAIGNGQGLFLRFPSGARLLTNVTPAQIQFTRVVAGFGARSPLQFRTGPGHQLERNSGSLAQLTTGPLDLGELLRLQWGGLEGGSFLPVTLFGFPLNWQAGVVVDGGLVGARFALVDQGLPLPGLTGAYPDLVFDLSNASGIQLPLQGSFRLGTEGPQISIPVRSPAWLGLRPDGSVYFKGQVTVEFPNSGPKFGGQLSLSPPHYQVQFEATGLTLPLLASLGQAIPTPSCLPVPPAAPPADGGALDTAAVCLERFDRALRKLHVALAPFDSTPLPAGASPAPLEEGVAAVLEAWSQAKLSTASLTPPAAMGQIFEQAGRSAAAAPDLHGVLATRLALERARKAGLRDGASAEFDQALSTAIGAVVSRSRAETALGSLASFKESLGFLLEAEQLIQLSGTALSDTSLQEAIPVLANRQLTQLSQSLGVQPGIFRSVQNPELARLDAFQTLDTLAQLVEVISIAQKLGVVVGSAAAVDETLSQLFDHLQALLEANLNVAEQQGDHPAFLLALQDYLELHRIQETGILPSAAVSRPLIPMAQLAGRLEPVLKVELERPALERPLNAQVVNARRFVKMLDDGLVLTAPSKPALLDAFNKLSASLSNSLAILDARSITLGQVSLTLEAGILAGRLREALTGTPAEAFNWESAELLGKIVDQIRARSLAAESGSELHRAVQLLLAEAAHHKIVGRTDRRGLCLQQVQTLLEGSRLLAGGTVGHLNFATQLADLVLPGEIQIRKIAGALTFNTASRKARADFSGELTLPKFDLALTVQSGSVQSDGALDLSAFGQIVVPSAAQPSARFTIPGTRPLHLALTPGSLPRLSGEGKLEINGLTLDAQLTLEDPAYAFALAASGIRFDLADKLRVHVPELPNGRSLDAAITRDLNRSIRSLGLVYNTFRPPATLPRSAERPTFDGVSDIPGVASLEAATDNVLANLGLGSPQDYRDGIASYAKELDRLEQQSAESWETARSLLDFRMLARICSAFEQKLLAQSTNSTELLESFQRMIHTLDKALEARLNEGRTYTTVEETDLFYLGSHLVQSSNSVCFGNAGLDSLRIAPALTAYHDRSLAARLAQLGINPSTGAGVPAVLTNLPMEALYAGITNLTARSMFEQWLNRPSGSFYETAVQTLGLEVRARCIAELHNHDHPEPTLEDYQAIRLWSERLLRLTFLSQYGGFVYPTRTPLPNTDGSSSNYLPEREQENWQLPYDKAYLHALAEYQAPSASNPFIRFDTYDFVLNSNKVHLRTWTHLGMEALLGLDEAFGVYQFRVAHERLKPVPSRIYVTPPSEIQLAEIYADYRRTLLKLGPSPSPAVQQTTTALVQSHLARIRQHLLPNTGTPSLPAGLKDLQDLCRLLTLAERLQLSEAAGSARDGVLELASRLAGSAAAQRAIDYATEFTGLLQLYSETLQDPDNLLAVRTAANDSLRSSLNLLNDLKLALPTSRPVDLQLPGDLVISRAHGEIQYNRDTQVFGGKVGGRLEFPDINAWFEVTDATFDTTGKFSLKAGLASPTPFNGVRITAKTTLSGAFKPNPNPLLPPIPGAQQLAFSGTGTVLLPGGQSFETAIQYDTTQKVLSLQGTANDLNLSFGPHLALFNVGAGVRFGGIGLGGVRVRDAELGFSGSAGLLRTDQPAVNASHPSPADFQLAGENLALSLALSETNATLKLTNGTLRLPSLFRAGLCVTNTGSTAGSAKVTLDPAHPILASLSLIPGRSLTNPPAIRSLTLSGSVGFQNIGIAPSGAQGLGAEICKGSFDFPTLEITSDSLQLDQMPVLTITEGRVQVPLPPGQTNTLEVQNFRWRLNGFPTGDIFLGSDLKVFDQGGFSFSVLGGTNCPGQSFASGLHVTDNPPDALGRPTLPTIEIRGGISLRVDSSLLQKEPDPTALVAPGESPNQVSGKACGSVTLNPNGLPQLTFDSMSITGSFRLGANGVRLKNASLSLDGIQNLFNPSEEHPFRIGINGIVLIPEGPGFGLQDSRFVFFDSRRLPRFEPGTLLYDQSNWSLAGALPIQVKKASLTFQDGTLGLPELFNPTNLRIAVSARAAFPPDQPVVAGDINDVSVRFLADGTPVVGLSSISLSLDPGLKIPPIEEIGGSLYVGGLDANPPNPFFVGRAAGSYQGYKLKLLFAFNLLGPVGLCLDVNAGSVGIPLDGGTAGFLLTGASGGMSFLNTLNDPCQFSAYMDPVTGRPVSSSASLPPGLPKIPIAPMTWSQLRAFIDRATRLASAYGPANLGKALTTFSPASVSSPAATSGRPSTVDTGLDADEILPFLAAAEASGARFTGPGGFETQSEAPANESLNIPCPGGCPPPTVNLFCQPHPDQTAYPGRIITKFTAIPASTLGTFGITRDNVQSLLSQGANLAVTIAHTLRQKIDANTPQPDPALLGADHSRQIREIQVEALDTIESGFKDLLSQQLATATTADAAYAAITNIAWVGLPCSDVTFKITGTFSQVAVSSFLSVTGGGTLSTTGSAGVGGYVSLLGLPVGNGNLFLSATDSRGLPNPSVCGDIEVSLGPISFGYLKAALQCDDCVTGMLGVFGQCALSLSTETLNRLVDRVAPRFVGHTPAQLVNELSRTEKTAFFAELFQLPASSLPANLPQVLVAALGNALDRFNPEFLLCGQVAPKIFGFPILGEFGGVQMRVNKHGRDASFAISPSQLLSAVISDSYLPGFDIAMVGYSEPFPDVAGLLVAGLSGKLASPAAIRQAAEQEVENLLINGTYTASYEFHPLGMKLARVQSRIVNPDLVDHPVLRGAAWKHPEDLGRNLPSRIDLLQAAVRANLLGNSLWKGSGQDISMAYPDAADQTISNNIRGLSLVHDYFPHGGFVGAGFLDVPRALYEGIPPTLLNAPLDPNTNALGRLGAAISIVTDYVLKSVPAGNLSFYMPAPNPPTFFQGDGRTPLSKADLLKGIMSFNPAALRNGTAGPLYSMNESFMGGYINGQFLGVPVANARLAYVPPGVGSVPFFQITAGLAPNSWLTNFVDQASLLFDIRQSPTNTIEATFSNLVSDLQAFKDSNPTDTALIDAKTGEALDTLFRGLPKARLEARLDRFHLPPALQPFLNTPSADATVQFFAYSPRFEPGFVGDGPVAEVRRKGGMAFRGRFRVADLVTLDNAEYAVIPKDPLGMLPPAFLGRVQLAELNTPLLGTALMRNVFLDVNTEPAIGAPAVRASGDIAPIRILPYLDIVPAPPATMLSGRIELDRSATLGARGRVSLSPARISLPLIAPTQTVFIDGGTPASDFTFASDPNTSWNARVTFQNGVVLGMGGLEVFRYGGSSISGTITNRGVASGTISIAVDGSQDITLFGSEPQFSRTVRLAGDTAQLTIGSDGSFRLSGRLDRALDYSAMPGMGVKLAAGADFVLTQTNLVLNLSGSTFGPFPNATAQGTLELAYAVQTTATTPKLMITPRLSGTLSIDPIRLPPTNPVFQILPIDPGSTKLTAAFNNTRLTVSGAKVRLEKPMTLEAALDPFALELTGRFAFTNSIPAYSIGAITLPSGTLAASNDPKLNVVLRGSLPNFNLGLFTVIPRIAGSTVSIDATLGQQPDGTMASGLRISPARIAPPPGIITTQTTTLDIDGGLDAAGQPLPFSFSTDPTVEWQAIVRLNETLRIGAGGRILIESAGISRTALFKGRGLASTSATFTFTPNASFTFFPDDAAVKRTFTVTSASTPAVLTLGPGASFTASGSLDPFSLPGLFNFPASTFSIASSPASLVLNAQIPSLVLGGFGLGPATTGGAIGLGLSLAVSNSVPTGTATIAPARLTLPSLLPSGPLLIDGGLNASGIAQPMTIGLDPTAPFTARVMQDNTADLSFSLAGVPVVSYANGNLQGLALERDTAGVLRFKARSKAGSDVTLMPGQPFATIVTLAAASDTQLSLASDGTFNASYSVPRLNLTPAPFVLASPTAGNSLIITVSNTGITVPAAQLAAPGILPTPLNLPGFTIPLAGPVSVGFLAAPAPTLALGGFTLSAPTLKLERTAGGVWQLNAVSGTTRMPWDSAATPATSISGTVRSLTDFTFTASLNPIVLTPFALESTAANGQFTATLASDGFHLNTHTARLRFFTETLCTFPLSSPTTQLTVGDGQPHPGFAKAGFLIPTSGNFGFKVTGQPLTLGGYSLGNANFTFGRTNGVVGVGVQSTAFNLPGNLATGVSLGGTINADGTYNLITSASPPFGTFTGFPVTGLSSARISLSRSLFNGTLQTQLTASGTLTGGILSVGILPASTTVANTMLTLGSTGVVAVSADVGFPSIDSGIFHLRPAGAATQIAGHLDSSGLTLTAPTLTVDGLFTALSPSEPIKLAANGDFSAAFNPGSLTIAGYPWTGVNFVLSRSNGVWSMLRFNGTRTVPGFGALLQGANKTVTDLASFDFSVVLPNLDLPPFHLTTLTARIDAARGLRLAGGHLVIDGSLPAGTALPELPIAASNLTGDFSVPVFPKSFPLLGYPFSAASFTLNRAGNQLSLANLTLTLPNIFGFSTSAVSLSKGTLASDGSLAIGTTPLPLLNLGTYVLNSMSASLSNSGLVIKGAQLTAKVFGGSIGLGDLSVPAGVTTDNFSYPITIASANILGYPFNGLTFNLQRSGTSLTLSGFSGNLGFSSLYSKSGGSSPLLPSIVAPFRLSGSIGADEAVALSFAGPAAGVLSLTTFNVGGIPLAGGLITLTSSAGLHLSGSFTPAKLGFALNFSGDITPAGDYTLGFGSTGGFYGLPVSNGTYTLSGNSTGNATLTARVTPGFTGLHNTLNALTLTGTLATDGSCSLSATSTPGISVSGFGLGNFKLQFTHPANNAASGILDASGDFSIAGTTYTLSGGYSYLGTTAQAGFGFGPANLTLGGFTATNGRLTLDDSGMGASGRFVISIGKVSFNTGIDFSGSFSSPTTFSLIGTGGFSLGGFTVTSGTVKLTSSGVSPFSTLPTLPFAGLDIPVNFTLSNAGVSGFSGSLAKSVDWTQFTPSFNGIGLPPTPVWSKADGTVSLSASSTGSISGKMSGTFTYAISLLKPSSGQTLSFGPVDISSGGAFTVIVAKAIQGITSFGF